VYKSQQSLCPAYKYVSALFEGTVSLTVSLIIAEQIISRWKKRDQLYGLLYFNCEVFCYDLAALICSDESRRKFLRFRRWHGLGEQEKNTINQSPVDERPGNFYYKSRSLRSFRTALACVYCLWICLSIYTFYLTMPSGLSFVERWKWLNQSQAPGYHPPNGALQTNKVLVCTGLI
jgi:hypothetical protein